MIRRRKNDERGHANRGWLDSRFTFSFAEYHDPMHMGFRALRVMNEDRIAGGTGFGPHAHRDMEIITYVLKGRLQHRDSMGQQHIVGPNEVQTMSAGSGIVHSEFNASDSDEVHLMQIWIEPEEENLPPTYQQVAFEAHEKRGRLRLLAGPHRESPTTATSIRQDAHVYVCELTDDEVLDREVGAGRHAWVQVLRGDVHLNGQSLLAGDGASLSEERRLSIRPGAAGCELLYFDLG